MNRNTYNLSLQLLAKIAGSWALPATITHLIEASIMGSIPIWPTIRTALLILLP